MSTEGLQPSPARQGPGRMPRELVEALDLALRRRTAAALPGERRAVGVGAGTELAQLRPYEIGDDVRQIDPAASARTRVPHVRLHVPERTMTTWIVLDVSPSMAFGSTGRLKSDVAEGVALVVGRLALRRAGRVAFTDFGGERARLLPPRGSRAGLVALRRALEEGVAPDGPRERVGLHDALVRVGRIARQPGLVVLVSDFRDEQGWESAIGPLRMRHAVTAVEIHDPREAELPGRGRLTLVDPETGRLVHADAGDRGLRERYAAIERERRERLAAELRRLHVDHIALSAGEDWLLALGRALR